MVLTRLVAALAGCLLLASAGCGDDEAGGTVDLTIVNATAEEIAVYIDGSQYLLDANTEDAISLPEDGEYAILATGLESGESLYTGALTPDDIAELDNRLVITSDGD